MLIPIPKSEYNILYLVSQYARKVYIPFYHIFKYMVLYFNISRCIDAFQS